MEIDDGSGFDAALSLSGAGSGIYADENENTRNTVEPPYSAISTLYSYRSGGTKSRGPTPNVYNSGRSRPDDIARQAQAHMQEAASLAAFNVLQNQVRSFLFSHKSY
jgi:hypothetical protein